LFSRSPRNMISSRLSGMLTFSFSNPFKGLRYYMKVFPVSGRFTQTVCPCSHTIHRNTKKDALASADASNCVVHRDVLSRICPSELCDAQGQNDFPRPDFPVNHRMIY